MAQKNHWLGIDSPLVREYTIASTFISEKNPDTTICKYIVPIKKWDRWEEVVRTIFVHNPDSLPLTWQTLKITTEII